MDYHFSQTAQAFEVSAIKRIELLTNSTPGAVSLAQGTPSFDTPDYIKEAAKKAIDDNLSGKYTPGFGIEPLRAAFAKKTKRDNGIEVTSGMITVTHGGIEALMSIFLSILNPVDEVIILTPDYASHLTQVLISSHGTPPICVPLTETETEWVLDPELLEKAVTKKTKAILVSNPCNPTGKVYTKDELKEIARIALKHNLYIIIDEMYEKFTYDGKEHISIGSFEEVKDRTISVFGVSKSYAMTGWRIGYIAAPKTISEQIFKIHDSIVTCPTAVSQYAALAAVTGPQDCVEEFKQAFIRRRKIAMDALDKTEKLSYVVPNSSYFIFPKLTVPVDDEKLAVELVEKAKVGVVPGTPFGKGGENHIRISFGCQEEQLKELLQTWGISGIKKKTS